MVVGFFALFDDIAMLLDDAAAMTKIATKKTAGILGDDLAVGADKASGFTASRELPILWRIVKGSFLNKAIVLPVAFVLMAIAPWSIVYILMLGGVYLAFEGSEKVFEYMFPPEETIMTQKGASAEVLKEYEEKKIKSAIFTDFILSIEITIIALNTVLDKSLPIQMIVATVVAVLATIGIYGFVASIIRIDDLGFKLIDIAEDKNTFLKKIGQFLVAALPKIIKGLSFAGTFALLIVAGGIFVEHIEKLEHLLSFMPKLLAELLVGLVIGFVAIGFEKLYFKLAK